MLLLGLIETKEAENYETKLNNFSLNLILTKLTYKITVVLLEKEHHSSRLKGYPNEILQHLFNIQIMSCIDIITVHYISALYLTFHPVEPKESELLWEIHLYSSQDKHE